jgi:hypothetical protein
MNFDFNLYLPNGARADLYVIRNAFYAAPHIGGQGACRLYKVKQRAGCGLSAVEIADYFFSAVRLSFD